MTPSVKVLPAQYAKFIAAVLGEAIAYVQLYGTTWHLEVALVMAGAALAVLGVPNVTPPKPAGYNVVSTTPPPPASSPPGTAA